MFYCCCCHLCYCCCWPKCEREKNCSNKIAAEEETTQFVTHLKEVEISRCIETYMFIRVKAVCAHIHIYTCSSFVALHFRERKKTSIIRSLFVCGFAQVWILLFWQKWTEEKKTQNQAIWSDNFKGDRFHWMPTHNSCCWRVLTENERKREKERMKKHQRSIRVCVSVIWHSIELNLFSLKRTLPAHTFPIHCIWTPYRYLYHFPAIKVCFPLALHIRAFGSFYSWCYMLYTTTHIQFCAKRGEKDNKIERKRMMKRNNYIANKQKYHKVCVSLTWKYSCVHFLVQFFLRQISFISIDDRTFEINESQRNEMKN